MKDYDYFVHPLTDGFPALEKDLLDEVAAALALRLPAGTDRLLAPEAMGLPVATALTQRTGVPFTVVRKRVYGLPGELVVPYRTGYAEGRLSLNGLQPGQRVVIVDDVVSRGGTLRALSHAVRQARAHLEKALVVVSKSPDLKALSTEVQAPVEALVEVRVRDGRLEVLGAR